MKILVYLVSVIIFLLPDIAPAETPIVYSRCKRTTESMTINDTVLIGGTPTAASRTFDKFDIYDALPDVTNFFDNFTMPCDLVYRDASGVETVLYDCSTTSNDAASCAALDANVSWDATKIVFALFKGSLKALSEGIEHRVLNPNADAGGFTSAYQKPNRYLDPQDAGRGSHILVYDFNTDTVTDVTSFSALRWDSGPVFIDTNRIAFTSNRDGNFSVKIFRFDTVQTGTRIYSIDIDGNNLSLDSHHSTSQEQHPYMLKSGFVAYSSWQIFAGLPFRHNNGTPGSATTDQNLFMIYSQRPDGSLNFPIFGQHSCDHLACSFSNADSKANHFIGQTTNERIWFGDYYRGNNSGMGKLIGVIQEPMGQEGAVVDAANLFVPNDAIDFAAWASSSDNFSTVTVSPQITHPNYTDQLVFDGKLSHPSGLPSNGLMFVWAKGACNNATSHNLAYTALSLTPPPYTSGGGGWAEVNSIQSLNMDLPGCDAGIYKASVIPSTHQSDLVMIVDTKEWHEIMPRAVVPYTDIYGVSRPTAIQRSDIRTTHDDLPKGTPFGLLGAASILDRETHPHDNLHYQGEAPNSHFESQFHLQGTDTIDYVDDDLCGIRIIGIMPNRGTDRTDAAGQILNIMGERAAILGEVPVLHYDGNGDRIMNSVPEPDTSFLVRMPADVPHMLQGIDCDGHTLNTDQTWQTVKPGEVKTCGGCHVHTRATEINFADSYAATANYTIPVLGEGSVQLLSGRTGNTVNTTTVSSTYGVQYTFDDDIIPILNSRCVSCHSGGSPAGMLNLDTTGETHNSSCSVWWTLNRDYNQACLDASKQITLNVSDGLNFRRPNLTKFMVAFNPLRSLFYWKAAGQRMDKKLDTDLTTDIDFGTAHTTSVTAAELAVINRWITLGAPAGSQETKDTQKPTLHLAATVIDNGGTPEITHLHIGTVDLGAGIDTSTLSVTVNGGSNLAVSGGQSHGITTIALGTPITAGSDVIVATVDDLATSPNTTTVTRTASYFLAEATTPDPLSIVSDGNTAMVKEGDVFTRAVALSDGLDTGSDGWTYTAKVDGVQVASGTISAGSTSYNFSYTFPDGDKRSVVEITIVDEASTDEQTITFPVIVQNVPPVAVITGNSTATVDAPYSITLQINDPGDDTVNATSIEWGDGSYGGDTTHTYTAAGNYTIRVWIDDDDGLWMAGAKRITVQ